MAEMFLLQCKNTDEYVHEMRIPPPMHMQAGLNLPKPTMDNLPAWIACPRCMHVHEYRRSDVLRRNRAILGQNQNPPDPGFVLAVFECGTNNCELPIELRTPEYCAQEEDIVFSRLSRSVFAVVCPKGHHPTFPTDKSRVKMTCSGSYPHNPF